jgi:hypothetical protein
LLLAALIGSLAVALWLTSPISPPQTLASSADEIVSKPAIPPGLSQPNPSNANIGASDFDNLGDPHDAMKEKLMIEHGLIGPGNGGSDQSIDWDDPHAEIREKLMIADRLIGPGKGRSVQNYNYGSVEGCFNGALCVRVP